MSGMIDKKFKEDQPLRTVARIRNALLSVGIFTIETWTNSEIAGCYSVRIELAGTHIGQNGKGVTRELALASGYAELMERIQSGYFYVGAQDASLMEERGFIYAPDEKEFTIGEYEKAFGNVLKPLANRMQKISGECTVTDILHHCQYGEKLNKQQDFSALLFTGISNGTKVYFPVPVLLDIYATNGTCAGNVTREAVVQGLSEIMERNHNLQVLLNGITPPTIPDDYLKQFPAYSMVREIRQMEDCELIIKDCSLGTDFPVIASVLISKKSHKYIVKFGAHPVFEIALERTLTEMFQGRNMQEAVNTSSAVNTLKEVRGYDNIHNVLKNASGKYAYCFFDEIADREFVPFSDRTEMDNGELFEYCVGLFEGWGYEIYIRDCSFLGFPSYQILVPGFSEIYAFGIQRLKEKASHKKAGHILCHLDTASESELNSLFLYLRYKENFSMENTLSFTLRQPLMLDQKKDVCEFFEIELCIAIRLKKWKEALWCSRVLESLNPCEKTIYIAMQEVISRILTGCDDLQARSSVGIFYDRKINEELSLKWDWDFCAKRISEKCRNILFSSESNEYPILRAVKQKLKAEQEAWYESNFCTQVQ